MPRALTIIALCLSLFVAGLLSGPKAVAAPPAGDEVMSTVSTSISSTAAVIAAVSGKRLQVKAMVLRSSGAGVVVFQDGSGGTTLANVYLEADKPFVIDDRVLGTGGITTTAGNGLYAVLSGATLTATFRVTRD